MDKLYLIQLGKEKRKRWSRNANARKAVLRIERARKRGADLKAENASWVMKEYLCFRTAYASEAIARTKLGQIRRGRARCKNTLVSKRQYEVKHCDLCKLWHVSSRNGKG